MCGIIGIIGENEVSPLLVEGLRRLEYRGYDSAGVAVIDANGFLCIFPDDDGTYTIKNRIGNYEKTFALCWLGED